MLTTTRLILLCVVCACSAQYDDRAPRYIASEPKVAPTPVAILKQINRHNEDGSYTYGYEAADGSFKIETKAPTGEVKGKYGYKDDTGKVRVIEYGADKYGFQPAGEGITVAPPTLVDESKEEERRNNKQNAARNNYRVAEQQQSIDYDYEDPVTSAPQQRAPAPPQFRPLPSRNSASGPPKPIFVAGAAPAPAPLDQQSFFAPEPQRPKYKAPKQVYRPAPQYNQENYNQESQPVYSEPAQNYQNNPSYQGAPSYPQSAPSFPQSAPSFPQQSAPSFNQRSNYQPSSNQQFSMLDKLLKEYALPQGGAAPLHDITFGSF